MLGERFHRALKPTRKYFWLIMRGGSVSKKAVRAKINAFSAPWKMWGRGQPIMWPMDR